MAGNTIAPDFATVRSTIFGEVPVAATEKLTNVAQTWGKVIPFSSGLCRIKGEQIWSSDYYPVSGAYAQSDRVPPAIPSEPIYDPFNPDAQTTAKTDALYAIDVAYSFGVEAIPGTRRIIKRLRVDGTTVYDIDNPLAKFSFSVYYGDELTQDQIIMRDMKANTPYYKDQIYIVVQGLVSPIPKEIDAEFSFLAQDFDGDHLVGKVIPAIDGRPLPDYINKIVYAYNFEAHTISKYDMETLEKLEGPIPCVPTLTGATLNKTNLVWLQKFGAFASTENLSYPRYSPLHIYDVKTGNLHLHGDPQAEADNTDVVTPKGIQVPTYVMLKATDTDSYAQVICGLQDGTTNLAYYIELAKTPGGIVVSGDRINNHQFGPGPVSFFCQGDNGVVAYSDGDDRHYIVNNKQLIKTDPLPSSDNYAEAAFQPVLYRNKIVWFGRGCANETDLEGRWIKQVVYGRTVSIETQQFRDYPNTACGYFGSWSIGDVFLMNLDTLTIKFYTTDTLLDGNSWACGFGFARKYELTKTTQLNFPLAVLGGKIKLKEFIRASYAQTGYFSPDDIMFDDVEDEIFGAIVIQSGDVSAVVGDIRKLYRIEKQDLGGKLRFFRNKKTAGVEDIALSVDHTELATLEEGQQERVSLKSFIDGADEDRPSIAVNFIDVNADFAQNTVAYKPPGSKTSKVETLNVPLVLDRTTALKLLTQYYVDVISGSTQYEFRLPQKYNFIGAGDIIEITKGEFRFICRISEDTINADWSVSCKAESMTLSKQPKITDELVPDKPKPPVSPVNVGPSIPIIFDIPALKNSDNGTQAQFLQYFTIYSTNVGWKGGYLSRKTDGVWGTIGPVTKNNNPLVADCPSSLAECGHIFDYTPLEVSFINGSWNEADNRTRAQLLANPDLNNAIYGAPGRYEIVRFQKIEDGKVIGILRGCRGTDVFTGMHQNGDKFIVINSAVVKEVRALVSAGNETYRGGSQNVPFDAQSDFQHLPTHNSLKPWAPYAVEAIEMVDDSIAIKWDRRDRKGSGWGAPAPQSDPNNFDVVIYKNGSPIRTIPVTDAVTATYTLADRTADGVSNQSIELAIYQVSDAVGRGFGKRVIVNVQ